MVQLHGSQNNALILASSVVYRSGKKCNNTAKKDIHTIVLYKWNLDVKAHVATLHVFLINDSERCVIP